MPKVCMSSQSVSICECKWYCIQCCVYIAQCCVYIAWCCVYITQCCVYKAQCCVYRAQWVPNLIRLPVLWHSYSYHSHINTYLFLGIKSTLYSKPHLLGYFNCCDGEWVLLLTLGTTDLVLLKHFLPCLLYINWYHCTQDGHGWFQNYIRKISDLSLIVLD